MNSGGTYKNGQQKSQQTGDELPYFFKTGQVKAQGKMIDDLMQGEWRFNRESGTLWQVGNFLDGEKHGRWVRYDLSGNLEYDKVFDHGKQRKSI